MKKYIYLHKKVIGLTFSNTVGGETMNFNWGDADTRIHRGFTNVLEFSIRDIDRRPVKLNSNMKLEARFFNNITNEILFTKNVDVVDSTRGRVKVTLTPQDIDYNLSTIRYVVVMIDNITNEEFPLFNDYSGVTIGYLTIDDSSDIKPIKPIIIEDLTNVSLMNENMIPETWWTTGAIRGTIQRSVSKTVTTVSIYFDNFYGIMKAEASLDLEVPSNNNPPSIWDTLLLSGISEQKLYQNFTGIDSFNFYGNFNWFRLLFKPDDSLNQGTIKKIVVL